MKQSNGKQLLTRAEAKSIMGGLKDVNDECPPGTHEFICVTGGPGLENLVYIRYCVIDWMENPPCDPPA